MSTRQKKQAADGWDRRMLTFIALAVIAAVVIIAYGRTHTPNMSTVRNDTVHVMSRPTTPTQSLDQLIALADDRQNDPRIQFQAGKALTDKERYSEARQYLERAVTLEPANAEAHNTLGVALAQTGMHREAIAAYRAAVDLNPDNIEAHYNMGTAALNLGDTDTAIDQFTATLALDSTFIRAYNNLGGIFIRQGDLDRAIAQFEKALTIDASFTDAHRNLASIYDHLGNTGQAAAHRAMAGGTD